VGRDIRGNLLVLLGDDAGNTLEISGGWEYQGRESHRPLSPFLNLLSDEALTVSQTCSFYLMRKGERTHQRRELWIESGPQRKRLLKGHRHPNFDLTI